MDKILNLKGFVLILVAAILTISIVGTLPKEQVVTIPITIPITIHKNCDDNMLPHIVYEIFVILLNGERRTIKYGISCQLDYITKDGNPRPELQKNLFQKDPQFCAGKVDYVILFRMVPGRKAAKLIEQNLVNQHVLMYKRMPYRQYYPLPKFTNINPNPFELFTNNPNFKF